MFENKYNSETNTKETEYVPVPEITKEKKSKGTGKVMKTVLTLLCIAALPFASIAGYKYITGSDNTEKEIVAENDSAVADIEGEVVLSDSDYEISTLFQLSKSEDALSTQEIYEKVLPSVVGITSKFIYEEEVISNPFGSFFGYNYGDRETTSREIPATGTGIIMSSDGYVITNAHVVYSAQYGGKAGSVSVLLYDGQEYQADIVGYDTQTDVAVLKVQDAPSLTAAEFGDSSALNVGDSAIAIGNPLGFDLFGTLTVGYISGLNREIAMDDMIMHLIQTDAAINSGNSGGPLINDRGQVIGINSMKISSSYSSGSAPVEGLGFAIPINEAQEIVNDLMSKGYVTGRPQLGITCQDVTASQYSPVSGVYIVGVNENGAADIAGLKVGDIIVGANGQTVTTINELNAIKNQFKAGDSLELTVIRENKYTKIQVVLEESVVVNEN